jgi:hypothetical protein
LKPAGEEYDRKDRRKIYPSDIKSVTLADESLVGSYKFCKEPPQPETTFEEEVKLEVSAQHVRHFLCSFLSILQSFPVWKHLLLVA